MSRTATYVFIGMGVFLHLIGQLSRPLAAVSFQNLLNPEDIRRF